MGPGTPCGELPETPPYQEWWLLSVLLGVPVILQSPLTLETTVSVSTPLQGPPVHAQCWVVSSGSTNGMTVTTIPKL